LWRVIGWIALAALIAAIGWNAAADSVDFPIYHQAGSRVLAGDFDLYPQAVYESGATVGGHGFRYAPVLSILFAPFGLLPLSLAALIFFLAKIAATGHMLAILCRRLDLGSHYGMLIGVILLTTGGYVLEELRGGNLQFFVVYFMVLAFDWSERGRVLAPACVLAISIAAKITPAVLLLYFVMKRRTRLIISTVTVLVLLLVAPAGIWGTAHNNHLLEGFGRYSSTALADAGRNYSLRGALTTLGPSGMPARTINGLWILMAGIVAAAFVFVFVRERPALAPDFHLALLMTSVPLLSPHSQRIYFVYLVVPVVVMYALIRKRLVAGVARTLAIASLVLLSLVSTIIPLLLTSRSASLAYMDLSPYTFSALFFLVVLLAASMARTPYGVAPTTGYL
jgi:hypothetical protein